ncbi:hypothetical protein DEJ15_05220 [Curtobacterium sp. MCJR17_043]|nr:hypothetical protein [Curtobacterium sp. MCJR17_043]WIB36527.1 hypothetical protein DEJ15_05220 [Curtobacterium sp. MCJR17_043]
MLGAALLVGAGLSTAATVATTAPASAAVQATDGGHFVCDQNTLYASNSAGKVVAIDSTQGTSKGSTVDVADLGTGANNGLGIAREGTAMYAAGNNTTATLRSYDPKTGTASSPVATDKVRTIIRGAVNPVTGYYYYGDNAGALLAYDPVTKKAIGQVGQITGLKSGNGDFAFSSQGLFFVVAADKVYRVNTEAVPTAPGQTDLGTTEIATLPSGTNSPGIAFSSDGYLYVSNTTTSGTGTSTVSTTTIYQLDPTSGTQVRSFPVTGNFGASDLASCNYADTVTGRTSVDQRWHTGDQFGLDITGDGITATSKGTSTVTTGSATGLQDQKAGAILTTPGKKYTVTQKAAGTADLADYDTTWKAVDVNSGTVVASGTGSTAAFTFPQAVGSDGTDVVVTFTNRMRLVRATTTADTYSTPRRHRAHHPGRRRPAERRGHRPHGHEAHRPGPRHPDDDRGGRQLRVHPGRRVLRDGPVRLHRDRRRRAELDEHRHHHGHADRGGRRLQRARRVDRHGRRRRRRPRERPRLAPDRHRQQRPPRTAR